MSLGIIRDSSDEYFESLSPEDIANLSQKLGMSHFTGDKIQQLKDMCRTRHIKMWHDHSSIAAHGYLLVLVSVIYDPAFFYTTEEMKNLKGVDVDVPAILDEAEVHILGRSSSSTNDQLMFIETRRECLKEIKEKVCTSNGVEVVDVIRFFYGDGPAAQFEAGHKQGGTYCCVGCGAESGRFSDTEAIPEGTPRVCCSRQSMEERRLVHVQCTVVTYCRGINTKQFIGLTHNFFPKFYGQRFDQAVLVFFRPVQNMTEENQHSLVKTLSIKFWKQVVNKSNKLLK